MSPVVLGVSGCFTLLADGAGAVMHVPAWVGSASHACIAMSALELPACLRQHVHVRSWPRIRSLYALCVFHANTACVPQVVGLS